MALPWTIMRGDVDYLMVEFFPYNRRAQRKRG